MDTMLWTKKRRASFGAMLAVFLLIVGGATVSTAAPAHASVSIQVCSPSGKCVNTPKVCGPNQCGNKALYEEVPYDDYCMPSVGCFTWKGTNYRYTGAPVPTAAEQDKMRQCALNLGYVWVSAIAGGPAGFTIGGVALALWGCAP